MLKSITVQNFKAFGEEQTLPLNGPITVLVGPNNSGKSAIMSVGAFVRDVVERGGGRAIEAAGGAEFLFHRPFTGDGHLRLAWTADGGAYRADLSPSLTESYASTEEVQNPDRGTLHIESSPGQGNSRGRGPTSNTGFSMQTGPLGALRELASEHGAYAYWGLPFATLYRSRYVKLSLKALREDALVVPNPVLGTDGSGLAAVLALWRGSDPERAHELDEFLKACLPEIAHALVKPSPLEARQRLWIQQADREMFDAEHISDGLLSFTALAMLALDTPERALIFLEEPEQSIHPRRLTQLVDLLRLIAEKRHAQFVVATHSPLLLNEFRDEPESIVLFSRGPQGARMKPLTAVPELLQSLQENQPGDLLANGFFNEGI